MHYLLPATLFASTALAQFQSFVTRPHDKALNISVQINNSPNRLSPGLFFLSPYVIGGSYYGPQIFTNDGKLIYYGNDTATEEANDAHVCNYLGQTVLCYNNGEDPGEVGHSEGENVALDHSYQTAAPAVGGSGGLVGPDTHETNTPSSAKGYDLLQTVYQPRQKNLTPYAGPANGYILDGCFQDISINDSSVYFQWCASDHLPLSLGYVLTNGNPNIPAPGNGLIHTNNIAGDGSQAHPWDWFHINSVDRDQNGDYLISSRHTSALYKIAGKAGTYGTPGSVIWNLGGKQSTFSMNYNFSAQHMGRFIQSDSSGATITLYNDATDGVYYAAQKSSGLEVAVNYGAKTSSLLRSWVSPVAISTSQGSMQIQPNGNALLGMGSEPYYAEYANDGTLIYLAEIGGLPSGGILAGIENYRAYKTEWLAAPAAPPDLVVYTQNCTGANVFGYASWNGATSVARWRFRGGARNDTSTFTTLANVGSIGFETGAVLQRAIAGRSGVLYVIADALNTDGRVLRSSYVQRTFVPNQSFGKCGAAACPAGTDYSVAPSLTNSCPS